MKISKIRTMLYGTGKILGDLSAVKKGKVKERLANRTTGKVLSKIFRRW